MTVSAPAASSAPAAPSVPAAPTVPAVWAVAAALLVLAPRFSASPFADDYDSQRLLQVAVWALLAAGVTAVPSVRAAWLGVWARVPAWAACLVAAVGVLGAASAATAARPAYAAAEVAGFVMMGVAAVAVASAGRAGARQGMAVVAVLALGGYAAFVVPMHLADLAAGAAERWPARHLGFGNVRQLNQLQAWTLPLVWALAGASAGWRRAALRAVAAVSVVLLVASNGRGIVVALAGGLAVAALAVPAARRGLLREAAVSVAVGVALWAVLFSGATVVDRLDAGTNGRAALWAGALRIVGAHPWLGIGPMHFVYVPTLGGAHPHNVALQLAAEWGLPAALGFAGLGAGAGAAWLRHARRAADAPWAAGLTCACAAAVTNGLVDGVVVAPVSQMVAALGVGALLAEVLGPARGAPGLARAVPEAGARWRGLALAAVVLPAAAVLLGVVAADAPSLHRRAYDYRFAAVSEYALPRFWSTGQIAARLPAERARFWPDETAGTPRSTPLSTPRSTPPPVPASAPDVPTPQTVRKTDATDLRTPAARRYPRPTPAAPAAMPASPNG